MPASKSVLALCCVATLSAPSEAWTAGRHHRPRLHRVFSEPSDEPSDVEVDAVVEPAPVAVDEFRSDLMAAVTDSTAGMSKSQCVVVNELLLQLEPSNPTVPPATSPLLNGVWEVVYNGGYGEPNLLASPTRQAALFLYAGGYTPGSFGLQLARLLPNSFIQVNDVEVKISREQPRSVSSATLQVGTAAVEVKIETTLETESDVRLKETYSSISVSGQKIDLPDALKYSRQLYITYLDDDILVVRDETGVPEVLFRKSKEFITEVSGEPSSADDDSAPGAG